MSIFDCIKKHISYTAADDVKEICKPLFEKFNLNYFDYARTYLDGSALVLISDRNWYQHYFTNNYPVGGSLVDSGVYLWNTYQPKQCVEDFSREFNYCHGLSVYRKQKNYIEFFDIAAPSSNENVLNFYFNHMDIINQFLFYFKDKAANLIDEAYKTRFIIPEAMRGEKIQIPTYDDFLKAIETNKIRMNFRSKEVILTKREYECLLHLAQGKTMKETAQKLKLSPRTIEEHLAMCSRENRLFVTR